MERKGTTVTGDVSINTDPEAGHDLFNQELLHFSRYMPNCSYLPYLLLLLRELHTPAHQQGVKHLKEGVSILLVPYQSI